jgi:hypothetical protein
LVGACDTRDPASSKKRKGQKIKHELHNTTNTTSEPGNKADYQ